MAVCLPSAQACNSHTIERNGLEKRLSTKSSDDPNPSLESNGPLLDFLGAGCQEGG
jgi:hypothetical protein